MELHEEILDAATDDGEMAVVVKQPAGPFNRPTDEAIAWGVDAGHLIAASSSSLDPDNCMAAKCCDDAI